MMRITNVSFLKVGCVGVALSVTALMVHYIVVPMMTRIVIEREWVLKPGSITWDTWISTPVPVYLKFYIFNVSNPHEIAFYGAKPIVREMGPYIYEERLSKSNVTLRRDGYSISYNQRITYHFRPDLSNGSESDHITIVNLPLTATGHVMNLINQDVLNVLVWKMLLSKESMFIRHSVRDILWDGIEIRKYVGLLRLSPFVGVNVPSAFTIPLIMDGDYSFFQGRNNTEADSFVVYSGDRGNTYNYSNIIEWNGHVGAVNLWQHHTCNQINGTDTFQFPPSVSKNQKLYMFITDLARSIHVDFKEVVIHRGIPGYRFTLPPEVFSYGEKNPDNWCFCTADGLCPRNGFFNITTGRGPAVLVSNPHFAYADQDVIDSIDGMHPDLEKHVSYEDVEPVTGTFLSGQKRVQVNIDMKPYENMQGFEKLPKVIFPILWFEEGAELDDKYYLDLLHRMIVFPLSLATLICWFLFALGVAICIASVAFWKYKNVALSKVAEKPIVDDGSSRHLIAPDKIIIETKKLCTPGQ